MSYLSINDLSYLHTEILQDAKVKGGSTIGTNVSNSTGSFATSASSDSNSSYYQNYFYDINTGAYGYSVGYRYNAAVAGAASGATGDGYKFTTAYTGAYTS
jgi:hypothetical protein